LAVNKTTEGKKHMKRLINKLFRMYYLNDGENCPSFIQVWSILPNRICRTFGFEVFLHRLFHNNVTDMHNHSYRFISVGLKGSYIEHTPTGSRKFKAPWIRTFHSSHTHRLEIEPGKECWTLCIQIHSASPRPWGYFTPRGWLLYSDYECKNAASKQTI
jgi:hypothetical protein